MPLTNQFFWIFNKFVNEELCGDNSYGDDPSGENEERAQL